MSNIKKLIRFHDLAQEYAGLTPIYNAVEIDLPENTIVTVTWRISGTNRFRSREFPVSDLPGITEKIRKQVQYKKSGNDTQTIN